MPRCCDPSRALASLKPNLVAMLTNPGYDLAITSPAESPALHLVQLPNGRVFFKATPPVNVVSVNTAQCDRIGPQAAMPLLGPGETLWRAQCRW
jgi:hypothetical protein